MRLLSCAVRATAVCLIFSALAASQEEPLCQNKACGGGVCRVVATCNAGTPCTLTAICLPAQYETLDAFGCRINKPLLKLNGSGQHDLRACYTENNCPDGFYCSTELQDVSSRCCRAHLVAEVKNGSCPVPENMESHFCVDQCLSDADCYGDDKCCEKTQSCARKVCTTPLSDPCSANNCPSGTQCVLDPDRKPHCLSY
ncbi:hypothetical protein ACOMHN_014540 [Nucella lapillus]